MRKVAEYEVRAEECRRRAQMKDPEQKKQLADMAQAWDAGSGTFEASPKGVKRAFKIKIARLVTRFR